MKKILAVILSIALLMCAAPVFAENVQEVKVFLDGEYLTFDVAPRIESGRTLVPLRKIFESLGATVDWNGATYTVVSTKGDTEVRLTIGENKMYVNGQEIPLDVPGVIENGRTLVPLRAVSEAYSCDVSWNHRYQTAVIVSDASKAEIMSINGESLSVGYYKLPLFSNAVDLSSSLGMDFSTLLTYWDDEIYTGVTVGEYLEEASTSTVMSVKMYSLAAKADGIELTKEEQQAVSQQVLSFYSEVGLSKEVLDTTFTFESISQFLTDVSLANKYLDVKTESFAPEKEAIDYLDKNYIMAKHILIQADRNSDNTTTESEKAEAKKLIDEISAKLKKGEDFDKLMNEFCEDPGVKSNPEGYLFTKGEMVAEFEEASFKLKEGQVSDIVETSFGYHIIKRVKPDYDEATIASVQNELAQDDINAVLEKLANEIEFTSNDELLKLITLDNIL